MTETVMETRRALGIDPELRTKATVQEGIVVQSGTPADFSCLVEYQPGNGTRYVLVLTRVDVLGRKALECLGIGSTVEPRWLVSLPINRTKGSIVIGAGDLLHYSYIQEKMLPGIVDAAVIAELIGTLCGIDFVPLTEVEIR